MRLKRFQVCGEQAITIVQLWIESCLKQTALGESDKKMENWRQVQHSQHTLCSQPKHRTVSHAYAGENFLMIFWQHSSCVSSRATLLLIVVANVVFVFAATFVVAFISFLFPILFRCVSAEFEINPPLQNQ